MSERKKKSKEKGSCWGWIKSIESLGCIMKRWKSHLAITQKILPHIVCGSYSLASLPCVGHLIIENPALQKLGDLSKCPLPPRKATLCTSDERLPFPELTAWERIPAAHSFYVFTSDRCPHRSRPSPLITRGNRSPLAVLCHPGPGVAHHSYNITTPVPAVTLWVFLN